MLDCSAPRNDFALAERPTRLPLHRRRHRHHADHVDDAPSRMPARGALQALLPDALGRRHRVSRRICRAPPFAGQVVIHHDGGDPARAFDLWPLLERPHARAVYCCGPRPMLQAVRDMTGHWPRRRSTSRASPMPATHARRRRSAVSRAARADRRAAIDVGAPTSRSSTRCAPPASTCRAPAKAAPAAPAARGLLAATPIIATSCWRTPSRPTRS